MASLVLGSAWLSVLLLLFTAMSSSVAFSSPAASSCRVPKLIAFDLDGTVWTPDMYMLWGGGSPFTVESDSQLRDKSGQQVRLLGTISHILHDLQTDAKWKDTVVSWVSCTDEPDWADECLHKLKTSGGRSLHSVVEAKASMIFKANKQRHFQKLRQEYPHIAFSEMLFFDNEFGNIEDVREIGVRCVHCPRGMTEDAWLQGLDLFDKQA